MKKMLFLAIVICLTLSFGSLCFADEHPEAMEGQKCITCHADATPDVVKQWNESAHGFTGVKCGTCHGDEKNFSKTPAKEVCRSCHSKNVDNNIKKELTCFTCHPAHHFNVHKVSDYKEKK